MTSRFRKMLKGTIRVIALFQFGLGGAFLIIPEGTAKVLGLSIAPGWANWLFGMMAARFLGFGYGMLVAARNLEGAQSWIRAMIVIQVIDWLVTVRYLLAGAVTLAQVSTASFLPLLFVAVLVIGLQKIDVESQTKS